MEFFSHHWISDRIIRIVDITHTALYLVLGDQHAMLIDTGTGIGSLRAYVDGLTSLPYDVLLTHGHVDHASGAYEFRDRSVYLQAEDRDLMVRHTAFPVRIDYARKTAGVTVSADALIPQMDPYDTLALSHGDRFDLGGIHLEVVHVPGHTHGMCMVLIEEERTMLFGDACGVSVMLLDDDATSVAQYVDALRAVKGYEERYDRVIRNHGTCVSPKVILDNVISCCDDILAGADDHYPARPHTLPVEGDDIFFARALAADGHHRADGKEGNVAYRPCKVRG